MYMYYFRVLVRLDDSEPWITFDSTPDMREAKQMAAFLERGKPDGAEVRVEPHVV